MFISGLLLIASNWNSLDDLPCVNSETNCGIFMPGRKSEKKPTPKDYILYDSICVIFLKEQTIEMEKRLVVPRGEGSVGRQEENRDDYK